MKRGTPMSNSESRKRHTAEIDAGRYVVEVWGADIGPGELLSVVSDALTAHQTDHQRVRVSYTDRVIPPEVSAS